MRNFIFLSTVASVVAHGALVYPISRNAIDRQLPRSQRTPKHAPSCTNLTGAACDNGQAQYWYSQGCFIGCPTCDSVSGRRQADVCGLGKKPTINAPEHRTVNRAAPAGSNKDVYQHNPWRAPGSAPVVDACGLAGGTPWAPNASEWGDYVPTRFASHGDRGSKVLGVQPSGAVWRVGGEATVVWQIGANHGGGYAYRLCPLEEELTEECFQRHPLPFNRSKQALLFPNGTRLPIEGTFVSDGTLPVGSTWAVNPIPPRCLGGSQATFGGPCRYGQTYPNCEPCPGTPGSDCTTCDNTPEPSFPPPCDEAKLPGLCSGNQGIGMDGIRQGPVSVADGVIIPASLKPGRYVLGWRLDCEATAQVWSNCADIEVVRR
jgi:lytic starch monooxygenase